MFIRMETNCNVNLSAEDLNGLIDTVAGTINQPVSKVKAVFYPNVTKKEMSGVGGGRSRKVFVQVTYNELEISRKEYLLKELENILALNLKSIFQNYFKQLPNAQFRRVSIPKDMVEVRFVRTDFRTSDERQEANKRNRDGEWSLKYMFIGGVGWNLIFVFFYFLYITGVLQWYLGEVLGVSHEF